MSKLRPECGKGSGTPLPNLTVLLRLKRSLAKRRGLIYGKLDDDKGGHCAMGCFWEDNTGSVATSLVDEVASVNDSVPPTATRRERWQHVRRWLDYKLQELGVAA